MIIICKFHLQSGFDPRISATAYLELDVKYSNTINIEMFGIFPESNFSKPLSTLESIF